MADDPRDIGREALQKIIDLITADATISMEKRSNRIIFNVTGGNSAVLIGKRGQTLRRFNISLRKLSIRTEKDGSVSI